MILRVVLDDEGKDEDKQKIVGMGEQGKGRKQVAPGLP